MIITSEEFLKSPRKFEHVIKNKIFIYPTNSHYCLGCDARNRELVAKIRELKKSGVQPFSIVPPSKNWLLSNFEVMDHHHPYLDYLENSTGESEQKSFTLLLPLKNLKALAPNVYNGTKKISVRIYNHWFTEHLKMLEMPLLLTGANSIGADFVTELDHLHDEIKRSVGLIIYEGEKKGTPTVTINSVLRK